MCRAESADSGFNTQKKLFQGQSIGKPFVGDLPERPPGTGQDGGCVAGRLELWHICVFIVAQGMENGAGEGGVQGWGLQDHSGSVRVCCCKGPGFCY